ncbi:hypothetical protein UA08_04194 [Talaromyces atroroseus]|uniref:PXA domain-containing protein n=1 Tax=Talaromyces atroroseus TaxID=1441469 RepID=A0A1Q5Q8H6_TALAT|nr:hypothetical protein UA08_04194 [Talaromyces atroroseus]OKL60329.1 hypothetical protein UA08_04194 [Talaromyces atroroseus]
MTTSLPRRGPSPFKPAATTTTSPSRTPNLSNRMESRTEHRRSTIDTEMADDKSTVALIRRVLCPDVSTFGSSAPRPLQELLPPLTSSNDVDLQLYALIAVIIKEFVYSWYAKITPDHVFVDEVLQLVAHCTRALEQRIRQVDIGQLVLDEVTGLVEAHIIVSVKSSTREVYHKLNPHPGLSPVSDSSSTEQQENERLYRHLLAQGVLAVLLPTEDLDNVCLRTLIEDVLSDLILGNEVGGRTCESWFIWTTVSKVIALTKQRDADPTLSSDKRSNTVTESSRLERFGLLSEDGLKNEPIPRKTESKMLLWVWKMLYSIYLAYLTMHFLIGGLIRTAYSNTEASTKETNLADHLPTSKASIQAVTPRAVISYRAFSLVSQLVGVSRRMPWLSGSLSLIQSLALAGPGKLGDAGSTLDR